MIYKSRVMQQRHSLEKIQKMLERHVEIRLRFPRGLFNMDGYLLSGIIYYARVLNKPEWIHISYKWINDIYETRFYSDGWWHERSISYHKQIQGRLLQTIRMLKGYSDPPGFISKIDGTRFDNLDLEKKHRKLLRRIAKSINQYQQPNRVYHTINDTTYPHKTYQAKITEGKSALSGAMGYGMLSDGKGNENIIQTAMTWGGTHGHEHFDALNLFLFAFGRELLSETKYRPKGVTNTTREWHSMTAGHNTVVVNERNQPGRLSKDSFKRIKQPEDAIPGVPDPTYRWYGLGNNLNDGFLRMFDVADDNVKIMSADAERAYGTDVNLKRYSRTVAMVKIDTNNYYIIDIFRVIGGNNHDYMLHSELNYPHTAKFSFGKFDKDISGSLHKYIKKLQLRESNQSWSVDFKLKDGSGGLKSFFAPQPETDIICGQAPAMRIEGTAPFVAVRHSGPESLFVAVHQPYRTKPTVRKIELLDLKNPNDQAVALKITLPNREDVVLSTTSDTDQIQTIDGKYNLNGRFGLITGKQLYLAGGNKFSTPLGTIKQKAIFTGEIKEVTKNAFITPAKLPTDGSLNNRVIMLDLGGLLVQAFTIRKVVKKGNTSIIYTDDDPGMIITPGLIKQTRYPGFGIKGQANFRIAPLMTK